MKIAFCLFKYFPFGGLQRDFLRIAQGCQARGHEVHVYTSEWQGEPATDLQIHLISVNAWQNHLRNKQFSERMQPLLKKQQYDIVVGFDKMPNLNIYYAADVCLKARVKKKWKVVKLLPRYRQLLALESAVFNPASHTKILLLSAQQQVEYNNFYQTPLDRFYLLPPGIERNRARPTNANVIRENIRKQFNLTANDHLILFIGSAFKTKGLDRALHALAALQQAVRKRSHLLIIGQDDPKDYLKLSKRLNVVNIKFLGGRADVHHFLFAADLLLHPAYHDNTGTVILEALIAGLPVITTSVCGYAHYVTDINAGKVVQTPFKQAELNHMVEQSIASPHLRHEWAQNGIAFGQTADIYDLTIKAVEFIEQVGIKT